MHWFKGLGLSSSRKRPAGESRSTSSDGKKSTMKTVKSALKTAFCIAEPAVKGQKSIQKATREVQRAARSAQMQAEKAQRVAEEAQREAARQARAERAEALREKLQRKRMSKIMDAWSLYSLRARINRVRIHVTLAWVQQDVEATRRAQMLREWLRLARQNKPLRPPGPRVPAKDLLIVCGSPLSPIAGARIRSIDSSSSDEQPGTPTRFYTAATHPADCKTCAACALALDAPDAARIGTGIWGRVGFSC